MKALAAVLLVLAAFTAFFTTFLIAPLAVLTVFYAVYVLCSARPQAGAAPAPESEPRLGSLTALAPVAPAPSAPPPARRRRVTVASRSETAAVGRLELVPDPAAPRERER